MPSVDAPLKAPRSVSAIGGHVFSKTGGMQLAVRRMLEFLEASGQLKEAFLRLDKQEDIPSNLSEKIRGFDGDTHAFLVKTGKACFLNAPKLWLCDHVNYGALAACLSMPRFRYVIVGYAYEFTLELSAFQLWALRHATAIVCISEYTKKLCLNLGVDEKRLHVYHLGVDFDVRPKVPKVSKSLDILFVGRMDESYKGQDHLVQAVARLKEMFPQVRLHLVGGGKSIPKYEALAREWGVTDQVDIPGYVSDAALQNYYANADIFAMPSQCEGFGFVFVEAMAHHLPCIASNEDAAQEVVEHGKTGYTLPYGDVDALFESLKVLLEDAALRKSMGVRGFERYQERFTYAAYKERFLNLIDSIV